MNEEVLVTPDGCPLEAGKPKFYDVVATRVDLLQASPGITLNYDDGILKDPNGLILLPLRQDWQDENKATVLEADLLKFLRKTYGAKAKAGKLEPYVLRVNAGECVQLGVFNLLLTSTETKALGVQKLWSLARADGQGDAIGDALMPCIVPLNVERGKVRERCRSEDGGDLEPSANLALSLPLDAFNKAHKQVPAGINGATSLVLSPFSPLPGYEGEPRVPKLPMTFYAGRLELVPDARKPDGSADCTDATSEGCPYKLLATPYAFGPLPIKSFGDVIGHGSHGLMGTVIVEPQGADVFSPNDLKNPVSDEGRDQLGLEAVVRYCEKITCKDESELREFREFVVLYQDGLNLHWNSEPVKDCRVCDDSYDLGEKGVSYRSAPFWLRLRQGSGQNFEADSNLNYAEFAPNFLLETYGEVPTYKFVAQQGEEVRFRVVQPYGRARQRAFTVYGNTYDDLLPEFGVPGAAIMSAGKALTAKLVGPDLNDDKKPDGVQPGCYLYRDGPSQFWAGGVWGILEVREDLDVPVCPTTAARSER